MDRSWIAPWLLALACIAVIAMMAAELLGYPVIGEMRTLLDSIGDV